LFTNYYVLSTLNKKIFRMFPNGCFSQLIERDHNLQHQENSSSVHQTYLDQHTDLNKLYEVGWKLIESDLTFCH